MLVGREGLSKKWSPEDGKEAAREARRPSRGHRREAGISSGLIKQNKTKHLKIQLL